MATKKQIIEAWAWIRKNNQSIPDDVLDLMKDAAIHQIENRALISTGLKNESDFDVEALQKQNALLLAALENLYKEVGGRFVAEGEPIKNGFDYMGNDLKNVMQPALNAIKAAKQ